MSHPFLIVRVGFAEQPRLPLPRGEVIGPLSVGTEGMWRVTAAGVLEEHGYVYFNGQDLFVQSADASSPLLVNGAPAPLDWSPVSPPCEIKMGGVTLGYALSERPLSIPAPPPRPPPPRAAPAPDLDFGPSPRRGAPRQPEQEDEETRLQPIEAIAAGRMAKAAPASQPAYAPAPSQPVFAPAAPPSQPVFAPPPSQPVFAPPSQPAFMPAPQAPPSAPLPAAPPAQESWIKARWREASGPQRALVLLLPLLIASVWIIFTDPAPPPRVDKKQAANTAPPSSASASAKASAAPAASVEAPAPPSSPSSDKASPSGQASASPVAPPASSGKTREREAADAVARGAFEEAAKIYEELAKENPGKEVYAEAARILRAKVKR